VRLLIMPIILDQPINPFDERPMRRSVVLGAAGTRSQPDKVSRLFGMAAS